MSTPMGPHGPYRPAIDAALDAKRPCWCEHWDVGDSHEQKVAEHPDCPTCTREGEAAWYLEQMLPHIAKVEHDRVEQLLNERAEKVNYGSTWAEAQAYKQGLYDAVGIMRHVPRDGEPEAWHL